MVRSIVQVYPGPLNFVGVVAQLGERLVCNQEATGSIPVSSTRSSLCGAGVLALKLSVVGHELVKSDEAPAG